MQHAEILLPCSLFKPKLAESTPACYRALSSSGSACTLLRKEKPGRRTAMMLKANEMTVVKNMSSGMLDCGTMPAFHKSYCLQRCSDC